MKKEILKNNEEYYIFKYTISRKKYAEYKVDKKNNDKTLSFFKNAFIHRLCNLGPQYRNKDYIFYMENDLLHNLYGHAYIHKRNNTKDYFIYNEQYTKSQFKQYINILNQLNYKRIY